MKLGTKLFLLVGSLLLAICLVVFIVPIFVAKKEKDAGYAAYLRQEQKQQEEEREGYYNFLLGEFGFLEAAVDSMLAYVRTRPATLELLVQDEQSLGNSMWLTAAQILDESDYCDFIQYTAPSGAAAVVTLADTEIYPSWEVAVNQHVSWVLVQPNPKKPPEVYLAAYLTPAAKAYEIGAWLPGTQFDSHSYYLFDPIEFMEAKPQIDKALEAAKKRLDFDVTTPQKRLRIFLDHAMVGLLSSFEEAQLYLLTEFGNDPEKIRAHVKTLQSTPPPPARGAIKSIAHDVWGKESRTPLEQESELRTTVYGNTLKEQIFSDYVFEFATAIGFSVSKGLPWKNPFEKGAPKGGVRLVDPGYLGASSFTNEMFVDGYVFDPATHIRLHPPENKDFPIGSEFAVIRKEIVGANTLVNVLEVTSSDGSHTAYLTIGVSFDDVLHELAVVTSQHSLMIEGEEVIASRSTGGKPLRDELAKAFENNIPKKDSGFVDLDGEQFYFFRFKPMPESDIYFFTLKPAHDVLAPVLQFNKRSEDLISKLSWQIFGIAFGVFVIALILIGFISRRFTKPIRQLAAASERVGAGKYDQVDLPKWEKESRNEVSVLSHSFGEMVRGLQDREKIRGVLDKVVSKEIADEILGGKVQLGGEVKEVTVLFADVRNFTKLSENLPPAEVIGFINSLMTVVTEVIEQHFGVIDKYVGDEVMALYGAPVPHKYSPLQAVLSGLHFTRSLKEWNRKRESAGLFTAQMGVGIHTGEAVAGNMGAEDRLNYTVLGANVNLASRLCDQAEPGEILITKAMYSIPQIYEVVVAEPKGSIQLKGFSEPVEIYHVVGLKEGEDLDKLSSKVITKDAPKDA